MWVVWLAAAAAVGWLAAKRFQGSRREEPPQRAKLTEGDLSEIAVFGRPAFRIRYDDGKGKISDRVISVTSLRFIPEKNDYLITADCQLKRARRSFYSSQIETCVDLAAGISVTDLATHLLKPLSAR